MTDMETFTAIIRELEAERNTALQDNKVLQNELCQVTQEVIQTKRYWESCKSEAEELKQTLNHYCSEVEHLQNVIHKKEEERMEMMNHMNFMSQENSELKSMNEAMNREVKTGREHLNEAEKEIIRLQRYVQDKDYSVKLLEEKLQDMAQVMKEREIQHQQIQEERHHLSDQLSQYKNSLQVSVMHEETFRHQLASIENTNIKLEQELEDRKHLVEKLHEELEKEKSNAHNMNEALRQIRSDMHGACLEQQKNEEEMLSLHQVILTLNNKLSQKQEENEAIRRNVEDIVKEIATLKRSDNAELKRTNNTRPYDLPCGDQRDKFVSVTPTVQTPRRTFEHCLPVMVDNMNNLKTESKVARDYTARSKVLHPFVKKSNSFLSSLRAKESNQQERRPPDHVPDANTSPLLKYTTSKFRTSRSRRTSKY
ncbi:hypothetical protein M8J77_011811 [Diaphorina citri]|nr:hypothetical protein M8J77_011811 [Diaphorina citri]